MGTTNRELAERFAAAAETRDVAALTLLYDPDAVFWNNVLGKPSTTQQVLEISRLEAERIEEYAFTDLRVTTTDVGFVIQMAVVGAVHAGDAPFRIPVCLVAQTRDGRITAIDEYVDSAHAAPVFAALLTP